VDQESDRASSAKSVPAGLASRAIPHPSARRRGRQREELQMDREERRRLDHHAPRLRHRRTREAAAGHLGRSRPRRRTPDRGAGLQTRSDKLARWADLGVTEVLFGLPDKSEAEVAGYVERLAGSSPLWCKPAFRRDLPQGCRHNEIATLAQISAYQELPRAF